MILGSSADDTSETLGPVLNLDLPNFPSSSRKESNPTTNGTVTAEETPAWFLSLFSLEPDKRTAKIRWRRHHGRSAYVPGMSSVYQLQLYQADAFQALSRSSSMSKFDLHLKTQRRLDCLPCQLPSRVTDGIFLGTSTPCDIC